MIIIAGYNHADKDAMMGEVTVIPRWRHGSEPPISFRHSSQFCQEITFSYLSQTIFIVGPCDASLIYAYGSSMK